MTSIPHHKLNWSLVPPGMAQAKPRAKGKFFEILKRAAGAWASDNCMKLAAALACYAVLSLAPLVVITFKIVSVLFQSEKARPLIEKQVQNLMGSAGSPELIDSILNSSKHGDGLAATIISVAVLLFGASGVFGELQNSMNIIWGVTLKPNAGIMGWIRARFLSMTMVLGLGFLLLISLFVSAAITAVSHAMLGNAQVLGLLLDTALSLIYVTLLLAMIYKWLPDVKMSWKYVWEGAFFTALLFVIGKFALGLYFQYGAPASAYGAFGSLAAVIIWVYYSAQILFFGAEYTKVHAQVKGHPLMPSVHAVATARNPMAPKAATK